MKRQIKDAYSDMLSKCYRPADPQWTLYGKRNITVCKEWRDSIIAFNNYTAPTYRVGLTLSRINYKKEYGPGNVEWLTKKELKAKREATKILTKWGTITVLEASTKSKLPCDLILHRMASGWRECSLLLPPRGML